MKVGEPMKPDPVQVAETLGRFIGSSSYPRPEFIKMVHEVLLDLIEENQDLRGKMNPHSIRLEIPKHIQDMQPAEVKSKLEEHARRLRERYREPKKSFENCAVCGEPGGETQIGALTTWLCEKHREELNEVF